MCNNLGCGALTWISAPLPVVRLAAHASAKVDVKINTTAVTLAREIATRATVPLFLFVSLEFILHSLVRIMEIAPGAAFTCHSRNSG